MENNDTDIRFGYSIAKFISEVATVESNIGHREDGLTVIGLMIDRTYNPVHILSSSYKEKVEDNIFNKSAKENLLAYLDKYDKNKESLLDKLEKLNRKELLLLPIKPKYEFTVEHKIGNNKIKKDCTIDIVQWKINKDTNQIYCELISDEDDLNKSRLKVGVDKYNKEYWVKDIEGNVVINDTYFKNHELISINRLGYVNTIVVNGKNGDSIIIDNTYIMYKKGDTLDIIGAWDKFDNLIIDEEHKKIKQLDIYKSIEKSIPYIAQHRVYIAPYKLTH